MIAIVDYGMGNLGSITKALEYVGGEVKLTSKPEDLVHADRIVLPGVGAFGDGMRELSLRGFLPVLEEEIQKKKKPLLGVCLGMQLLAYTSTEFGEHKGLGWIKSRVVRLSSNSQLKVPHVGWNGVRFLKDHPMLTSIESESDFYFVHSYHMLCEDKDLVIGTVEYGEAITAIVAHDNIFATQFHPEKSQKVGLQILKNFLTWH